MWMANVCGRLQTQLCQKKREGEMKGVNTTQIKRGAGAGNKWDSLHSCCSGCAWVTALEHMIIRCYVPHKDSYKWYERHVEGCHTRQAGTPQQRKADTAVIHLKLSYSHMWLGGQKTVVQSWSGLHLVQTITAALSAHTHTKESALMSGLCSQREMWER